jgi:hypothetical protein
MAFCFASNNLDSFPYSSLVFTATALVWAEVVDLVSTSMLTAFAVSL